MYQQARDFVDLISHFLGECEALAQEPLDPSMSETPLTATPLHGIGEDIWAFVKSSLNEFAHLEELSDCFVRLAKQIIQLLPNFFRTYLTEFLQLVIGKFDAHPHSCFIYAIEVSFHRYHIYTPLLDPVLLEAFDTIVSRCTRSIVATREAALSQPWIVSDLFGLCRKYLNRNKQLFF